MGVIGLGCRARANRLRVWTSFSVDYIPARSPSPFSGATTSECLTVIKRAFEVLAEACKAKLSAQLSPELHCLQTVWRWQSGRGMSASDQLTGAGLLVALTAFLVRAEGWEWWLVSANPPQRRSRRKSRVFLFRLADSAQMLLFFPFVLQSLKVMVLGQASEIHAGAESYELKKKWKAFASGARRKIKKRLADNRAETVTALYKLQLLLLLLTGTIVCKVALVQTFAKWPVELFALSLFLTRRVVVNTLLILFFFS